MNEEIPPVNLIPERQRKLIALTIGLGLVATLLAVGVNLWYTNRVSHQSERKWCGLLVLIDDANKTAPPPQNETVAKYRQAIHQLRQDYRC